MAINKNMNRLIDNDLFTQKLNGNIDNVEILQSINYELEDIINQKKGTICVC